ncbi:MAG: histidine kinase dimerization/phospho-acceptor domain-containing protein [Pseudomonadota bacterium]
MTVLSQPAGDRHDSAVRWRQLVDLVARAGPNSASPAVEQALDAIRSEAGTVDETLRAATARAVAALPLPLALLQYFAADRLSVSAPVLAAATLDSGQWRALYEVADEETRRFIETLHPETKPAPPLDLTETFVEPQPSGEQGSARAPSLRDVVTRIERRRRGRSDDASGPQAPPPGSPALFRWECGPSGEIAWVDGAPRGALVGRSIARPIDCDGDHVDEEVARAFALRAPFRDAVLMVGGDGLVSGEWKISGIPAFEPSDGRFAGYRGVAMRDSAPPPAPSGAAADLLADPDALRELVHEIKTPLNAIIGFAEIIEGQYLGPADRRYRERAMEIVGQARLLLMAIDDLDFAAKIHSVGNAERPRVDLGELAERMAPSLRERAAAREVELEASRTMRDATAALQPELADRLIFRMCSAIVDRAQKGERLRFAVDQVGDRCRLSISLPAELAALDEQAVFGGDDDVLAAGFRLRLARGLARIAGGDIERVNGSIALTLPRG